MTRAPLALISIVGITLSVGVARADAVGPPPTDCPDGSRGEVCHGAEYCGLAGCIGSRDCAPGERCAVRELCVGPRMCFGRGGGVTVTEVRSDSCAGCTGRCESQFVCVGDAIDAGRPDAGGIDGGARDAGTDDDPLHSRYCGCAVPTRHAAPTSAIAASAWIALALLGRRARRRVART